MCHRIVRCKIQAERELKDQEIRETIRWTATFHPMSTRIEINRFFKSMNAIIQMDFNIDREEKKAAYEKGCLKEADGSPQKED